MSVLSKLIVDKFSKFKFQEQPLHGSGLERANMKHYKIMCRVEFDIGPDTEESAVEFKSTLDR
jgi:hypothetical protein